MITLLSDYFKYFFAAIGFVCFFSLHAQSQQTDNIYDAVEKPAQPKGGMEAFEDYISQNLTYPTSSLRNKIQGTVEVSFVIEKNGMVSTPEIVKGLDEACNKEAIRVIKNSPKWEPAKHKGQTVRQRLTMPLTFNIPGQEVAASPSTPSLPPPPPLPEPPKDTTAKTQVKQVAPEESARPEGGLEAFFAYLRDKQKYPAKALKNKVEGKVMVEFMVEKDGSLSNFKVLKKFGNGLDEEAVRLIEKGPKWIPAQYNGQPIRQKMILPVIFKL